MKKLISILVLILVFMIGVFYACKKTNLAPSSSDTLVEQEQVRVIMDNSDIMKEDFPGNFCGVEARKKIHIGVCTEIFGCDFGCKKRCGKCWGVCIIFRPSPFTPENPLTAEMIEEGIGSASICLVNDKKLRMIFDQQADNGDGFTRIMDNFNIGKESAALVSKNSVVIKPGAYKLHFSEEFPFGWADFDVVTN